MDLVYVVGPDTRNEELRYSLRSVARNLMHDVVWIVGYKPAWVTGVEYLPVKQHATKWQNSTANLVTACDSGTGVAERFALMNDDFYVLESMVEVPILNRGPVAGEIARYRYTRSRYVDGIEQTATLLKRVAGIDAPISYELHVPLPVVKSDMRAALHLAATEGRHIIAIHKRTLYGNLYGIGGETRDDVKLHGSGDPLPDWPLVSTATASWRGLVGKALRARFPEPCIYEKE